MIHNQIDYILVHKNKKQNLQDARTYAGTETFSDHKLVVMVFENDTMKMFKAINKKKKQKVQKRFNTRKLMEMDTREEYQEKIEEEAEAAETWEVLGEICKKAAEETIGFVEKEESHATEDDEIKKMSIEQKEIRMRMMHEKKAGKVEELRLQRREKQRCIKQKLKELRS